MLTDMFAASIILVKLLTKVAC